MTRRRKNTLKNLTPQGLLNLREEIGRKHEDSLFRGSPLPDDAIREERRPVREEINRRIRKKDPKMMKLAAEKAESILNAAISEGAEKGGTEFSNSSDYRSIRFQEKQHTLTANQAYVVKMLHEAYTSGTPALSASTILEGLGTQASRLRDTFKRSDLWGTLILPGEKRGTYRLNLSVSSNKVPE